MNKGLGSLCKFVAAHDIQDAISTYKLEMGQDCDIESIVLFAYEHEHIKVII